MNTSTIAKILVETLIYILPMLIANFLPVVASILFGKGYPMDFNYSIDGERVLGENKTWRGMFAGVTGGVLTCLVQNRSMILGFWMGTAVMTADALKSFIKRRLNKPPGEPWIADYLDVSLGIVLLWPFYDMSLEIALTGIVISPLISFAANTVRQFININ